MNKDLLKAQIEQLETTLTKCRDGFLHTLCRLDLNRLRKQLEGTA